jgi:hypothetical protein
VEEDRKTQVGDRRTRLGRHKHLRSSASLNASSVMKAHPRVMESVRGQNGKSDTGSKPCGEGGWSVKMRASSMCKKVCVTTMPASSLPVMSSKHGTPTTLGPRRLVSICLHSVRACALIYVHFGRTNYLVQHSTRNPGGNTASGHLDLLLSRFMFRCLTQVSHRLHMHYPLPGLSRVCIPTHGSHPVSCVQV